MAREYLGRYLGTYTYLPRYLEVCSYDTAGENNHFTVDGPR